MTLEISLFIATGDDATSFRTCLWSFV